MTPCPRCGYQVPWAAQICHRCGWVDPTRNSFIKAVFIFIPTIIILGLLGLLIFHVAS